MTKVFSTNRAIREFYVHYATSDIILPKAITIFELESKAIIVKDKILADDDTRFLLLREAADFEGFKNLYFDTELLVFLNHSKYIFNFFEELASENIKISQLRPFDTYALYDEHLDLLEILRDRYIDLLKRKKYFDKITIGNIYDINIDYLINIGPIEINIDGYLSKYEIELFDKFSKFTDIFMIIELNTYNLKIKDTFAKLGIDLEINHKYKLNLGKKEIIEIKKINYQEIVPETSIFNTRLAQIGYIFSSISQFISSGINPQDIVVVLPDEGLAPFLKEFDTYKNLNFAMGFSLDKTDLFRTIEAITLYINVRKEEQDARLERLGVAESLLSRVEKSWQKKINFETALEIINEILGLHPKELKSKRIEEEVFRFTNFLRQVNHLTLEQILKLFQKRLKAAREDDVRGGKITVMGLLETRSCSFKGVIVPDFSDEFVPKRSSKDLFLNTKIRKETGLPTKKDRENLQKYYYYKLFINAKKIAISSVANETSMPSRFLDELHIKYENCITNSDYAKNLFLKANYKLPQPIEVNNLNYRLDLDEISATKLSTMLTCKRKFYFKYICKLKEPKNILQNSNASIGLKLHKALELTFKKGVNFGDSNEICSSISRNLKDIVVNDNEEFELDVWIMQLSDFIKNEKMRYEQGYRVFANELELKTNFEGFKITGKLDRVDIKDGKLCVIDYKSGDVSKLMGSKIDNMTNFQLEFYYLLAGILKEVDGVYYYDLKNGNLIQEPLLQEKIDKLKIILKTFKKPITTFEMCEKRSNCIYCPYKKLCLRG